MYKGKKFNSRKEDVDGPEGEYLGIKIFRFYFKCSCCHSEITMRTDPKNHDYVVEHGATRNHDPLKDLAHAETVERAKKELESEEDAMKKLEHKTYDNKREMDIMDALEQVRQLNKRKANAANHEKLLLDVMARYDADTAVLKESLDELGVAATVD